MEAIRLHEIVKKDGEISVTGLPCKKGQNVEMILLIEPARKLRHSFFTARLLLNSGLIGLWKNRKDIKDNSVYARNLREGAQRRQG